MELVFRHGLIQQALAEGMPAGLRAELHRDAARALADSGAGAERVAGQLLAAKGDVDDWAVDWLTGHAAELVHRAPRAAAQLLERTLAGAGVEDRRREALTEHLADALFLLARYEQAEPVARELLAGTGDPQRRARMAWTLAYTLSWTGQPEEALAVLDQALLDGDMTEVWSARLKSGRALTLLRQARVAEAGVAAAAALADAERVGDRFAIGYALHVQAVALAGDPVALSLMERALTVIGNDPETADLRLALLSNRLGALSNLDQDVAAEGRQLLALAEQAGTARTGMVQARVADCLFDTGRWDDALAELEALFEFGADAGETALLVGHGVAALIAAHRDDRASLTAHLRAADELAGRPGYMHVYAISLARAKAAAAERDGRPAEARAVLATFLSVIGGAQGNEPPLDAELYVLPDLVRCAVAAGDLPAARRATDRCAAAISGHLPNAVAPNAVAGVRCCRGLVDGDAVPLEEAVAYYRSVTRPLELGQALEDLAVVRAGGGDVAGARAALREAVELFGGLGAEWDVLRADARLRVLGVRRGRSGARRPVSGWGALTPTEVRVAYLVGEGLSNPEIGARLFLSRYTVQVHVSRILAKLPARSRVEVAGVVARQAPGGPEAAVRSTA